MQAFIKKKHWSGSKLLVSAALFMLGPPGIFLENPLLLCVGKTLQPWVHRTDTPPHAPAGHRWGGCWSGPTHSPVSGTGYLQLSLPVLPCLLHQGGLHSLALASSPLAVMSKGQAQSSTLRIVLPQLHFQGQLYCVAQGRCRGRSTQ